MEAIDGMLVYTKARAFASLVRSVPERPNILSTGLSLSFPPEEMRHSVEEELDAPCILVIAIIPCRAQFLASYQNNKR